MIDHLRAEREAFRWMILLALNHARPSGTTDHVLLRTAQDIYMSVTTDVIRREMGYLAGHGLLTVNKANPHAWHAELTSNGVDVVEYRAKAPDGVARPDQW